MLPLHYRDIHYIVGTSGWNRTTIMTFVASYSNPLNYRGIIGAPERTRTSIDSITLLRFRRALWYRGYEFGRTPRTRTEKPFVLSERGRPIPFNVPINLKILLVDLPGFEPGIKEYESSGLPVSL